MISFEFLNSRYGLNTENVCTVGQIQTSHLLLRCELEKESFDSWTLHESFRPMS